jgi:hypothetical protein
MSIPEETLMAFADGEALRQRLRDAYATELAEALPQRLLDAARRGPAQANNIVNLQAARDAKAHDASVFRSPRGEDGALTAGGVLAKALSTQLAAGLAQVSYSRECSRIESWTPPVSSRCSVYFWVGSSSTPWW